MITISLCMIVKNEEKVLKRCLDSLSDIMDEIIIVDTGSTDKTKEIAHLYTDKVYDYEWSDDFSAARNYSFSKATMDYIYVADADEVIDDKNRERFIQLKEILLPEIEIVQMLYCNQLEYGTTYNFDEEYRPKLYKRLRTFIWEEPLHEAVRLEPIIYDSDIRIEHKPLDSHAGRDFSIFFKMERKGLRISKKLHTMYAKELFIAGEYEDFVSAIPIFEKTMIDESRSLDEVKEAACVLARAYRLLGREKEFFKNTLKEVASNPSSEICYELGEFYVSEEDYLEAVLWYYNAAYESSSILNIHCGGDWALERLAFCYEKLGNYEQAKAFQKRKEEWEVS
ncbi:tetratricopeptide repeat-containing glycosyltransferase family 2 protein [Velocimicrobium porci]|uniref:Glycosyltransferase family 2 protein n=1 Tax=Velocimicrobium porci TaxID=2606634 RepID=A0A6L5XVJ1_9FIRM|nr:glycosyltransferase family 2 protein [Velocimicrobium porci]MSS62772.1 glycosyltransferase family 2 protein [Velocimicrobium porci]